MRQFAEKSGRLDYRRNLEMFYMMKHILLVTGIADRSASDM
jgi:hypothetical protein